MTGPLSGPVPAPGDRVYVWSNLGELQAAVVIDADPDFATVRLMFDGEIHEVTVAPSQIVIGRTDRNPWLDDPAPVNPEP